ncbi:MAG: 30S ribosomal protein S20 [Desulfobacterales bacterium]
MANHKSAIKRARQNEKKRTRNRSVKTRVKNVIKETRAAIADGSSGAAADSVRSAQSIIDKAAKKGVIHKRSAARKISRLTKKAAASSAS